MGILKKITVRNAPFILIAIGHFVVAACLLGIIPRVWRRISNTTYIGITLFTVGALVGAGLAVIFGLVALMSGRGLSSLSRVHYALRVAPVLMLTAFFWYLAGMS